MLPILSKETDESDILSTDFIRMQVYSNSSCINNSSGCTYLVKKGRVTVTEDEGAARPRMEVYDAEIVEAMAGLKEAIDSRGKASIENHNLVKESCGGYSSH